MFTLRETRVSVYLNAPFSWVSASVEPTENGLIKKSSFPLYFRIRDSRNSDAFPHFLTFNFRHVSACLKGTVFYVSADPESRV